MNGEQIIPPITDPLGRSWRQPHRRFIEYQQEYMMVKCGKDLQMANGIFYGLLLTKILIKLV